MYSWSFLLFNVCINPYNHVINKVPALKRHLQLNHGSAEVPCCEKYRVQHGNQTTVENVYNFKGQTTYTIKSVALHLNIQDCREKKD